MVRIKAIFKHFQHISKGIHLDELWTEHILFWPWKKKLHRDFICGAFRKGIAFWSLWFYLQNDPYRTSRTVHIINARSMVTVISLCVCLHTYERFTSVMQAKGFKLNVPFSSSSLFSLCTAAIVKHWSCNVDVTSPPLPLRVSITSLPCLCTVRVRE